MKVSKILYISVLLIAGCMNADQFTSTDVTDPDVQLRLKADYLCTRDLHQSGGFGTGWEALIGTRVYYDKCMAAYGFVRK